MLNKNKINKKIVRIIYSTFQKLYEFYLKIVPNYGAVVMFHQVDNDKNNWDDENLSISTDSFQEFIEINLYAGRIFSSLDDFDFTGKIYVTFDDGYIDTFYNAYPILKKLNIPFCVFITYDYLGKPKYMNKEMLLMLKEDPLCTFGSHTVYHSMLRFENDSTVLSEVENSKILIENIIKSKIDYFAYPYGSFYACSQKVIKIAKKVGYKLCFSTIKGNLNPKIINSFYFIPRLNINSKNYRNIKL